LSRKEHVHSAAVA
jgi:hypothetical protein